MNKFILYLIFTTFCLFSGFAFSESSEDKIPENCGKLLGEIAGVSSKSLFCTPNREEDDLEMPSGEMGITIKPKITTGIMYYKHEGISVRRVSDYIPFISAGLTLEKNNWFFEGYILTSDKGHDHDFGTIELPLGSINTDRTRVFSRKDYSGAIGYTFNTIPMPFGSGIGDISLFIGYREGKLHHLNSNEIQIGEQDDIGQTELNFTAKGPFLGSGFSFKPFENSNSRIGVVFALGQLTGEYTGSTNRIDQKTGKRVKNNPELNDTKGKTYGIYWSSEITPNVQYSFSFSNYEYEMDFVEIGRNPVKEQLITVKASLSIKFDL